MAEDRPLCKCHGEPMHSNGRAARAGWRCPVKKRARVREHHYNGGGRERRIAEYQRRKNEGVCTRCQAPLLTSSLCWDCLNDQEARDAIRI